MSVIYITDHNEVIYDVIKTRQKIIKPPSIYPNRLDLNTLKKSKQGKQACGTMGPAEYPPPDPLKFLKKHPKIVLKKKPAPFKRQCTKDEKCGPLPPKEEAVKETREDKNFIKENVIFAKKLTPPGHEPKFVDSRLGTICKIKNSGLEPEYIFSSTYGKSPSYLLAHEASMKNEVQIKKDREVLKTLPKCRYITRQERDQLLNGLKKNWEEKQKEFQLLPIITDTIPKILRMERLEKELRVLEKDIVLIEKHPYIYILDEDN